MVFGLNIILQLLSHYILTFIWFLICKSNYCDRMLYSILRNNINSHSLKNSKTIFMYSLAIWFLIFAGVSFQNQSKNLLNVMDTLIGSDLSSFTIG